MRLIATKQVGRRKVGDVFDITRRDEAAMIVQLGQARYADAKEAPPATPVAKEMQAAPAPARRRKRKKKPYNRADMAGDLETKA